MVLNWERKTNHRKVKQSIMLLCGGIIIDVTNDIHDIFVQAGSD